MKTKLLLYCTKGKPYLADTKDEIERYYCHNTEKGSCGYVINGKIVAECECEVEEMYQGEDGGSFFTDTIKEPYKVSKLACLNDDDIEYTVYEHLKEDFKNLGYQADVKYYPYILFGEHKFFCTLEISWR